MKVNFKDIKENNGFEPLPIGWYQVSVDQADEISTPGKAPYLKVRFEVTEGLFAKRKMFRNFILTEAASPFFKPFACACGYAKDFEGEIQANDFIGVQLMVFCNHKKFNEKIQEDPTMFKSLIAAGVAPTVKDDVPF